MWINGLAAVIAAATQAPLQLKKTKIKKFINS